MMSFTTSVWPCAASLTSLSGPVSVSCNSTSWSSNVPRDAENEATMKIWYSVCELLAFRTKKQKQLKITKTSIKHVLWGF